MSEKPRDILEFLRRAGSEPTAGPSATVVEPPPRARAAEKPAVEADFSGWILVKRRQAWIAGIAAGLFAILTFVIGLSWSSPDAAAIEAAGDVGVWTIRAIEYDASSNGEVRAKSVASQLRRMTDDEVTVQPLDRDRKLLVVVGSWLRDPTENEHALKLLQWVQEREVNGRDRRPFKDAYFYRIKR